MGPKKVGPIDFHSLSDNHETRLTRRQRNGRPGEKDEMALKKNVTARRMWRFFWTALLSTVYQGGPANWAGSRPDPTPGLIGWSNFFFFFRSCCCAFWRGNRWGIHVEKQQVSRESLSTKERPRVADAQQEGRRSTISGIWKKKSETLRVRRQTFEGYVN